MPVSLITPSKTATIASGAATSSAIEMEDLITYGLDIPTIDSGTFKIQGTVDGTNYRDIYDEFGNQVLLFGTTVATTGGFVLGRKALEHIAGFQKIQFVTSVNQTALRTLTIFMRDTERG